MHSLFILTFFFPAKNLRWKLRNFFFPLLTRLPGTSFTSLWSIFLHIRIRQISLKILPQTINSPFKILPWFPLRNKTTLFGIGSPSFISSHFFFFSKPADMCLPSNNFKYFANLCFLFCAIAHTPFPCRDLPRDLYLTLFPQLCLFCFSLKSSEHFPLYCPERGL